MQPKIRSSAWFAAHALTVATAGQPEVSIVDIATALHASESEDACFENDFYHDQGKCNEGCQPKQAFGPVVAEAEQKLVSEFAPPSQHAWHSPSPRLRTLTPRADLPTRPATSLAAPLGSTKSTMMPPLVQSVSSDVDDQDFLRRRFYENLHLTRERERRPQMKTITPEYRELALRWLKKHGCKVEDRHRQQLTKGGPQHAHRKEAIPKSTQKDKPHASAQSGSTEQTGAKKVKMTAAPIETDPTFQTLLEIYCTAHRHSQFGAQRSSVRQSQLSQRSDSCTPVPTRATPEKRTHVTDGGRPSNPRRSLKANTTTLKGWTDLKLLLEDREDASIQAWLAHFDTNGDSLVSLDDFVIGMRQMSPRLENDIVDLFNMLDVDGTGQVGRKEIDLVQRLVWQQYRHWATDTYQSLEEVLQRFELKASPLRLHKFRQVLVEDGWIGGFEELLFASLDTRHQGRLTARSFAWFQVDKFRCHIKEQSLHLMDKEEEKRSLDWSAANDSFVQFKQFLVAKYGGLVRAWRCALSPDDSLVLQKHQFLKAIVNLGYPVNVQLLWRALDSDDSGEAMLDELEPADAELFAIFRKWIFDMFSSIDDAFDAFDLSRNRVVLQQEFVEALQRLRFPKLTGAPSLFHGIDRGGRGRFYREDLAFLERWRPLPILLAKPNCEAADELRALLLTRFGSFLKAWRREMDKDSSNHVHWSEFENACRRVNFTNDVPGAWRAFDSDLSGSISLHELDPVSNTLLIDFRRWADKEFGGVRSAFRVFNAGGTKEISLADFRLCCRIFGFRGRAGTLFRAFDINGNGVLTMEEVKFLDQWDTSGEDQEEARRYTSHFPEIHADKPTAKEGRSTGPSWNHRSETPQVERNRKSSTSSPFGSLIESQEKVLTPHPPRAVTRFGRKPGLAAWHSRKNPWHRPQGMAPSVEATIADLLHGRPPPVEAPAAAAAAAAATTGMRKSLLALSDAARRAPSIPAPVTQVLSSSPVPWAN